MNDPTNAVPEAMPAEPPPLPPAPEPRTWGFWATLGWFLLAFLGTALVCEIAIIPLGLSGDPLNGDSLSVTGSFSAVLTVLALSGCVRLRRGWTVQDYIAVHPARVRTILAWVALIVAWSIGFDVFQTLRGEPVVPDVMLHTYGTATAKPLLLVFVVVLGPMMEEFAVRGFLYRGWAHSRIGAPGAVVFTSILFGMLHTQYDLVGMVFTGTIGFIFAMARLKTGSIVPGIAMHAVLNAVASVETVWVATHTAVVTHV